MDGLYLPPKPAIILPRPKEFVRPDDVRFKTPLILGGLLIDPYRFAKVSTLIDKNPAGSSNIGDMTNAGGIGAAFDSNTSQARASACTKNTSTSGFGNTVGKDWGVANSKIIDRWITYGSSDEGFLVSTATGVKLQGSNDNSNWDDLDSFTSGTGAGGTYDRTIVGASTAYRYHRVNIQGNGANSVTIAEITWYELI